MDTKKVIEKLVRIAISQQKIINKLAQALPPEGGAVPTGGATTDWSNATAEVSSALQQATQSAQAKGHYSLQSANMGKEGTLDIKMEYARALMGSPEVRAVRDALTNLLKGKQVAGKTVGNVLVVGVPV